MTKTQPWLSADMASQASMAVYFSGTLSWAAAMVLPSSLGSGWAVGHGLDLRNVAVLFLVLHVLSLGLWGRYWDSNPEKTLAGAKAAMLVNLVLTLFVWGQPVHTWAVWYGLMGVVSAGGVSAWGRTCAHAVTTSRLMQVIGLSATGVIAFNLARLGIPSWVSVGAELPLAAAPLLVTGLACLLPAGRSARRSSALPVSVGAVRLWEWVSLGLFTLLFALAGSMAYALVWKGADGPSAGGVSNFLLFIGVALAGFSYERYGLKRVAFGAGAALLLSFVVSAWGGPPVVVLGGRAALTLAMGFVEPVPILLFLKNATQRTAGRWFAWGAIVYALQAGGCWLLPASYGTGSPMMLAALPVMVLMAAALPIYLIQWYEREPGAPGENVRLPETEDTEGFDHPRVVAETESVPLDHQRAPAMRTDDAMDSQSLPAERLAANATGAAAPVDLLQLYYGAQLSERELQVGRLVILGMTTNEIAEVSFITVNTVKTHLRNIYRKTSTTNRHDLYRRLMERDQFERTQNPGADSRGHSAKSGQEVAHRDVLASLPDRAAFATLFDSTLALATAANRPFAAMLLEIGLEQVGDANAWSQRHWVLVGLTSVLSGSLRPSDSIIRWSRSSFLVLLPSSGEEGSKVTAKRVVRHLKTWASGRGLAISLRLGLASTEEGLYTPEALLRAVEHRLVAKEAQTGAPGARGDERIDRAIDDVKRK